MRHVLVESGERAAPLPSDSWLAVSALKARLRSNFRDSRGACHVYGVTGHRSYANLQACVGWSYPAHSARRVPYAVSCHSRSYVPSPATVSIPSFFLQHPADRVIAAPPPHHGHHHRALELQACRSASVEAPSPPLRLRSLTSSDTAVGPYSQAVRAGPHIFVSGQIPADAAGTLVEGSIADKTKVCCEGLKSILEDSGSGIEKVVKVTVFLASMDSFAEMNSVYEKYFTHKPARSCVAVKELPKGVPVEIEAIALA
nr:rutc family protein [Quercus suber]